VAGSENALFENAERWRMFQRIFRKSGGALAEELWQIYHL
jgi:hypothetical protein